MRRAEPSACRSRSSIAKTPDSYSGGCGKITFHKSGSGRGESGSATASLAPASFGADAHRIINQLQALAMNEGYRWKKKLLSEQGRAQFEKLALGPWASRHRIEEMFRAGPKPTERL